MLVVDVKMLLIAILCIGYLKGDDEITIQIADGKIKGRSRVTINNVPLYSFQGIPYAQPPINELRFQAPVPVEPWEGILDATREGNICYQVPNDFDNESGDCLFINVFTPAEPSSEFALTVMVFIYGGEFVEGSSREIYYGPDHFMEYGVVLVTFNYRVGPFGSQITPDMVRQSSFLGFFSTGDDAIPGNAGLKDQNLALMWVQKNIASFGGDPTKVTIFGESAGAASVGYHILSPLSKGLFRGAIGESGSPLSAWAYQRDQVDITYQTVGCVNPDIANTSSSDLLEYLLGVSVKDIDAASHTMASTDKMSRSYMLKDPDLLNWLCTSFDENSERLIPRDMHITSESNRAQAAKQIKDFYVGNSSFTENPLQLVKYFTDQCFVRSIIKHATLQSAFTDVYFYRFAFKGILGGFANESAEGFSETVRHAEELSYIFRRNYNGRDNTDLTKYPEKDRIVFKRFITLFTNFAKTLNPTPQPDDLLENIIWPKVSATDFAYLDIGSSSEIKYHPREPNYHEWEAIFYRFGVPPYDTY